ncbi:biopolymer transporter ExbB [Pseudaestuariivita sp.]|uniref:biopolymer transporter ExbB n=1 Tax=Pseudaestuariivita sp. TaxID=2211669 RepID=UPI004057E1F7
MEQPGREASPYFSQPIRQIVSMLVVLGLVGAGAFVALPRVLPVFLANPYLNGFILFVFAIGVAAVIYQVVELIKSVRWVEAFAAEGGMRDDGKAPRLLGPLANLLKSRGRQKQISSQSTQSMLDSVATRIDEAREITRYIVNLLVFLGLLGTFYGLATTVPAIVDTIGNLEPRDGETGADVFRRLQSGLEAQMGGMGVAFASSLLGLAGSLVVGLLELFASHGQNRFYRELEEWLSSITRLSFATGEGEGSFDTNVVVSVLDHFAEQMEQLQHLFGQSEINRASTDDRLGQLADSVERMTERMEKNSSTNSALLRVAEGQERLMHVLEHQDRGEGMDAESRMRLRSIDVQMLRILEELSAGRQESMAELRTDLASLSRALGQSRMPAGSPTPGGTTPQQVPRARQRASALAAQKAQDKRKEG